jgi:hypothetical protein
MPRQVGLGEVSGVGMPGAKAVLGKLGWERCLGPGGLGRKLSQAGWGTRPWYLLSTTLFALFTVMLVLATMELVAHDMHAYEMHAYGCTPRCTPTRCTPMRYMPVRAPTECH